MKETKTEGNINNEEVQKTTSVLVIYNISKNLTRTHLQEIFSAYGGVKGVHIPKDGETKQAKNYAFIEYDSQGEADKASLYMGGGQMDGLIIRTEVLNPKYYNQKKKSRSRSRDKENTHKDNDYSKNKAEKNNSYNDKKDKEKYRDKEYKRKSHPHRKASKSLSYKSSHSDR